MHYKENIFIIPLRRGKNIEALIKGHQELKPDSLQICYFKDFKFKLWRDKSKDL